AGLGVLAAGNGDLLMAATMFALAGSLSGFLPYNWPPARIFLGDSGSLFVGFTLGVVAVVQAYTHRNQVAVMAPLAILMVPLLDLTLVVLARLRHGRSPFVASHDHFAVRLRAQGWSAAQVALFSYGVGLLGALSGVTMVWASHSVALVLAAATALLFIGLLAVLWRLAPAREPALNGQAMAREH
ncbi:MAG: undecaprenyl/decaprenyl-phosphate alpha-N-acetylglucosaminyl 1-phosphate transferase, partial [Deltaproteobacteria bacterium]|nr:undecaprenyl/decaprenyl-phosphate alpha-N-acetylglucosaminyl 1-phosphate transferase [Deltaproteobacteria bacterium]